MHFPIMNMYTVYRIDHTLKPYFITIIFLSKFLFLLRSYWDREQDFAPFL